MAESVQARSSPTCQEVHVGLPQASRTPKDTDWHHIVERMDESSGQPTRMKQKLGNTNEARGGEERLEVWHQPRATEL